MERGVRRFDVIVIGAGSGLEISSQAAAMGFKTAVVEEGPFGGTCLNRGCIPSKMLIHAADVVETIKKAPTFGIFPGKYRIDWKKVVGRATHTIDEDAKSIEQGNREEPNITVYKTRARFVGRKQVQAGKDVITADKIFICAGSRPSIPQIPGLQDVPYITSDEALRLPKQPKELIIIGGGYIGTELAHFFGTLGTKVTILQRNVRLVPNEDWEIADRYTEIAKKKFNVVLKCSIRKILMKGKKIVAQYEADGKVKTAVGDQILIAAGRVPNTDTLEMEKAGVELTEKGFVKVNEFMETSVPGIWAIGDIAGKWMFKHSANLEAAYAVHNAFNRQKIAVDYNAMPHAAFSSPQIGAVGYTEEQLKEEKIPYVKSVYQYYDSAMGFTLDDREGIVKLLVDPKTKKFLGCHIIGAEASTLIHELILAMKMELTAEDVRDTVHIHPALPEVIQRACGALEF